MGPKEVINRLAKMGIIKDVRTLQRYAKAGLVPNPQIKSSGRGKGKESDYPESTPVDFLDVPTTYNDSKISGVFVEGTNS